MKYWDASGIVPLLVCLDQRLIEAGRKEGFILAAST